MSPAFRILWQLFAGAAPLVIAAVLIRGCVRSEEQKNVPPGWTIIRPPGEVACLLPDGDQIWAGGRDGLCRVDRLTGKLLPPLEGEPRLGYVHALMKSSAGAVWVAHDGGVAVYDRGHWASHGGKNGIPFRRAFSLAEGPDGTIWAGTDDGRVAKWRDARWQTDSLSGAGTLGEIDVLAFDRSGRLWAGSSSPSHGGLCLSDRGKLQAVGEAQGLPHPSVNAVLQDASGTVWVGAGFASQGAAARMLPGADRLAPFPLQKEWEGKKVRSLFQDARGRMWIGLEYDGALVFDGSDWKRIAPGRGLAGQEVKVVRQDVDGIFWLGTNGGLTRYDESIADLEDQKRK